MSKQEVFRGVNKYIDYTTREEYIQYTEPTSKPATAKLRATNAHGGKNKYNRIGNRFHMEKVQRHWGESQQKVYDTYFEYLDSWVERAESWVKI
jgi:hypothetical protein